MKIVVLDGYALNPGDLSWAEVEALGEVICYDRTASEQVLERAAGADVLLTNKTPLTAEILEHLPDLKFIGVLATGYNVVDIEAARRRGILVSNVPAYGTPSVAQHVFALLLELCSHTQEHSQAVRSGQWGACPDFCFWNYPIMELAGQTMGIVGYGRIGRAVAGIAAAFGMQVLAYSPSRSGRPLESGFAWVELADLLAQADVVSLHCPLTADTTGLINTARLRGMKPTAFLINTARGPLIDEQALADALNAGVIAGAGLDVLQQEPPADGSPLLTAKNCIITPHMAWASRQARQRLMTVTAQNIAAFAAGKPQNVVNG